MTVISAIELFGSVCAAIMAIFTFIAFIFKLPVKWIKKYFDTNLNKIIEEKIKESEEKTNQQFRETKNMIQCQIEQDSKDREAMRASLRHSITYIYYKYLDTRCLPVNVKNDLCSLYAAYELLNGNSYIHEIYEDMMKWQVK